MKNLILLLSLTISNVLYANNELPNLRLEHKNAKVFTKNNKLIISTGKIERTYIVTAFGLATIGFQDLATNLQWIYAEHTPDCDWVIDKNSPGYLISLNACVSDDEKFTDTHIYMEAEFKYPEKHLMIKYTVWVYPNAEGLRTQLQLKALSGYKPKTETFSPQVTETVELSHLPDKIKAFGLMQGIKTNMVNTDLLTEIDIEVKDQKIDWANGLIMINQDNGMILVKESNKSTNLEEGGDVATGGFEISGNTVKLSGAGMFPQDLKEDRYQDAWANWIILTTGSEQQANLALKEFDRTRYPVNPQRDVFIMANTWGTEDHPPACIYAAREENVLKELESVANLGIDVLQIDEGWQNNEWLPAKNSTEFQRQKYIDKDFLIYPEGWSNVREKADELGVKLGLWASWTIPEEKLKINYDNGNFSSYKLDFARLNTAEKRYELMNKARNLIKYADYNTIVNWDVTEDSPRAGYFYGREYGNVYLANRKINTSREQIMYIPHKVLKDAWQLAKYVNLNKFQITIQNIDMVGDTNKTDAHLYNHTYVVGIALMSSPIFFQETHYYTKDARNEIKPLLAVYKQHRSEIYKGYVFPIGEEPDNQSWTGFQNYNPDTKTGYLTIFRELHNTEKNKIIDLKFLDNKRIELVNLLTNENTVKKQEGSAISFTIEDPATFQFYRYNILD